MVFIKNKNAGFTLLEILIASSIFAVIMVITVGIIAQTSAYQSKLKEMKNVSEETRRLADQITRDVRAANGSINNIGTYYKDGIMLMNCTTASPPACTSVNYSSRYIDSSNPDQGSKGYLSSGSAANANTLVVANGSQYAIYWSANNNIYYATGPNTGSITFGGANNVISKLDSSNIISGCETTINFAGFAPDDATAVTLQAGGTNLQPYVEFYIKSKTKNYSTLPPNKKYQTEIRSMVTARSFN